MTMKLEQQVISLPIAKRLKELGVGQESIYYFLHIPAKKIYNRLKDHWYTRSEVYKLLPWLKKKGTVNELFSAFTVAELGEMLPPFTGSTIKMPSGIWHITIELLGMKHVQIFEADTEADARGKMLIYLLEQGLIKLDE